MAQVFVDVEQPPPSTRRRSSFFHDPSPPLKRKDQFQFTLTEPDPKVLKATEDPTCFLVFGKKKGNEFRNALKALDGGVYYMLLQLAGYTSRFVGLLFVITGGFEIAYLASSIRALDQFDILSCLAIFNTLVVVVIEFILGLDYRSMLYNNHCDGMSKQLFLGGMELEGDSKNFTLNDYENVLTFTHAVQLDKTRKGFQVVKKIVVFLSLLWLAAWWPPVMVSILHKLEENDIKSVLFLSMIAIQKLLGVAYAAAGGTSVVFLSFLGMNSVQALTNFIELKTEEERETFLDLAEYLTISSKVNKLVSNVKRNCNISGFVVHLYLVYTIFSALQLVVGVLGNIHSDGLLIPVWVPNNFFVFMMFFLFIITSHGFINVKFELLNDVLAQLNLLLREKQAALMMKEEEDDEQMHIKLQTNAELLTALLKTKKTCATFLGVPITTRMLGTIYGELVFTILVALQFLLNRFDTTFTLEYLPQPINNYN